MELILCGHEDRYAVEQLCLSLFPQGTEGKAVSTLHRGKTWLTAKTVIVLDGKTAAASRRIPAQQETVSLRRRILQRARGAAGGGCRLSLQCQIPGGLGLDQRGILRF